MNQTALFHDSIADAIGADIAAAGGFKAVAGKLWPADSPTMATQKLRNALNPDQPHKLCPDELLAIKRLAREFGSTATVDYEAQQLGYQVTWVDPQDQAEELQRRIADGMETLTKMVGELRKVQERTNLRAVK